MEVIFEEIMAVKFPNCMKNMNLHIQAAKLTPSRMNSKGLTPRYITVNLMRHKES